MDFHYNDTDVSIEGNSQVLLSTLIEKLNITDAEGALIDVNDVVSVSFTDERLVTVEEVSGETEVNGEKVTDRTVRAKAGETLVVQVGKRKWARVTVR